jgi:hypothetical protein
LSFLQNIVGQIYKEFVTLPIFETLLDNTLLFSQAKADRHAMTMAFGTGQNHDRDSYSLPSRPSLAPLPQSFQQSRL